MAKREAQDEVLRVVKECPSSNQLGLANRGALTRSCCTDLATYSVLALEVVAVLAFLKWPKNVAIKRVSQRHVRVKMEINSYLCVGEEAWTSAACRLSRNGEYYYGYGGGTGGLGSSFPLYPHIILYC